MLKVEQRHRDAAVAVWCFNGTYSMHWIEETRAGHHDEQHAVQAFARFEASLTGGWEVPAVWPEWARDRLQDVWREANQKHGHYEALFAVAAEGVRIASVGEG